MDIYALRTSKGDLSSGTQVIVIDGDAGEGARVETRSPIPVVRQSTRYDAQGRAHHETEYVKYEKRTFDVTSRELVKRRRR